jgi:cytosine/adenosine deaminase-related metal-dependent hydrolase
MDATLSQALVVNGKGDLAGGLPISMGRIGAAVDRRAYRINLSDHVILPGLINAHDHLPINSVPPLAAGSPFTNSYGWIEAFQSHFDVPQVKTALQVPKPLRLRHGALKNLLAGTTCVAHHDYWHEELDEQDFPVAVLREYGWSYMLGWPQYGPAIRESFAATDRNWPWMIHLAEGTDAIARGELLQLEQLGCLADNTVLIHAVGLDEEDVGRVIGQGAAVVWCPTSNYNLLGRTLDPRRLCAAGRLTLGTDSRLSGSRDLLQELCGAVTHTELGAAQVLELVTTQAASILRLTARGTLRPGAHADLVIVEKRDGSPAASLVGIGRSAIRAVVRDGVPRIADPDFAPWFAAAGIETVRVKLDGRPKLLDACLAQPELLALEPGLARAECA